MQEVQLDSKVKLLDSPGVVLASGLKTDASVALRNAIRTGMSRWLGINLSCPKNLGL